MEKIKYTIILSLQALRTHLRTNHRSEQITEGYMQAILKYKNWRQIIYSCLMNWWASLVAQLVKNPPAIQETLVRFLGGEIPWWRDRLPTSVFTAFMVAQVAKNPPAMLETGAQSLVGKIPWRRAWLPTPVFLPGESHGHSPRGSQRVRHDWRSTARWAAKGGAGGSFREGPACDAEGRFDPRARKSPWRRERQFTPVFLPGDSPWTEEPGGLYSPRGLRESDTTEQLTYPPLTHTHREWACKC